tara:strand:- start:1058 stop:1246 length:189 start_codon:yes stop_codon:yes gene_type:complete
MTLDEKNELELYRLTIKNRLKCIDKLTIGSPVETAIDDLKSIKAKTDYMLTSLTGWGIHHEK